MLRSLFEDRIGLYHGVAVRDKPWFETDDTHPNSKAPLVETIRETIQVNDRVVHVGGGKGIAPVWTARWAYHGHTTVYEVAAEMVDVLRNVRELNQVDFSIEHASVGTPYDPYGQTVGSKQVQTDELAGDLLVLDCEGAEQEILPVPQFDRVVVETHPETGADAELIIELMGAGNIVRRKPKDRGAFVVR